MSLAKLRLSPYYGKLQRFQASDEGCLTLKDINEAADLKAVKVICSHLDLAVDRKDGQIIIHKPGHDFFEALDMTAPDAKDSTGLGAFVARGDIVGAEKLASRGTVSQTNLFTALLALPQGAEPKLGERLLNTMSGAAEWPDEDSSAFFNERARQATLLFLTEGKECLEKSKSKDSEALIASGRCKLDVMLTDGRVKGEIQVNSSNNYEGGRRGRDGQEEEVAWQGGRGILTGDCVQIGTMDGGHKTECEVVLTAPLILRPLAEPPPGTTGTGKVYRVDGLANRQHFARTLTAVHLCSMPLTQKGNNIKDRKKMFGLAGHNRPSDSICSVLFGKNAAMAPKVRGSKRCKDRGILKGLNMSQRNAMAMAASRCFTLVQGPPGTGKTTVAVRILKAWALSSEDGASDGVLCSSDSNIAVDNIVEGLVREGVNVVRVGRPESARPEVVEHCVDEIAGKELGLITENSYGERKKLQSMDSSMRQKMKETVQSILRNADVVCCTAIGAGSVVLNELTFSRVLVDEAAQATELATLVPIVRGSLQVVLCGDQCQLPPTIGVEGLRDESLEVSLFERLTKISQKPLVLLDAQHRSHPAISSFARAAFYGGRLFDGVHADDRPPPKGFRWPNRKMPVCFLPARGSERREGPSCYNEREADLVIDVVKDLIHGGLETSQIGIVTPYAAQVRLFRRLLVKHKIASSRERSGVETNSVDGYQGREKEAIVISTVRSSSSGGLGFVADWRRANVAFTRARRGLIVVGDPATLGRDAATWGPWLQWVKRTGCYSPAGSLDHLPRPHRDADTPAYVGLEPEPGMTTEELLRVSADAWAKGKGDHFRERSSSRTPSWGDEESSDGSQSPEKRRKVEDKGDAQKHKDKKGKKEDKGDKEKTKEKGGKEKKTKKEVKSFKKEKREQKKEKKRLKKVKKKEKKAKKGKKKKSSASSSDSSSISSSLSLSSA